MTPTDPLWDDPFHASAWQAFAEGAARTGAIPDGNATKRRCYELYERGLAEKDAAQAGG